MLGVEPAGGGAGRAAGTSVAGRVRIGPPERAQPRPRADHRTGDRTNQQQHQYRQGGPATRPPTTTRSRRRRGRQQGRGWWTRRGARVLLLPVMRGTGPGFGQ